jgi:TetR/AcrR family fatty acid metabolism transcriptional regulator
MSSPARQTKAGLVAEFRRTQILDAARDRFAHLGVSDTTVDHIARAAHVAKGTVYLYYRSKDEILRQVLVEDLAELREETLPSINGTAALDVRLTRYIAATLGFFERKRDFIEHCQLGMSPDVRKKVKVVLNQLYQDQIDAWDRALATAARQGTVLAASASGAGALIVGFARGLALQRLAGRSPDDSMTQCADRAGRLLWKGLATR